MDDSIGAKLAELARKATDASEAPLIAFITNLGKYNEGELVGKWHPFPTTKEEIQKTLLSIDVDGKRYEEFFVTDYETMVDGLYDYLPEYVGLDELNYLANKLAGLDKYELMKLEAVLESGDSATDIKSMINLTESLDCFDFLAGVRDDEDLGYYWIEESGVYDLGDMGNLANYLDYESFGRDIRFDEGGTFTDEGYIRHTGDSMVEEYDGIHVPEEYRVFAFPGDAREHAQKRSTSQDMEL